MWPNQHAIFVQYSDNSSKSLLSRNLVDGSLQFIFNNFLYICKALSLANFHYLLFKYLFRYIHPVTLSRKPRRALSIIYLHNGIVLVWNQDFFA